jgi:hypothetical protein
MTTSPRIFTPKYAGQDVAIEIASLDILAGQVPGRALRLVLEWAGFHQDELMENWRRVRRGELPVSVEPLP